MDCPETMKAAVLFGFNDVRMVERPRPSPGPDEVLIKVKSCGVCAGDIKMITRGMLKQPPFGEFIIGHEYAGTVVQVGETVDEFAIGDRVAVEVHKGCGRCRNCLLGKYTACLNYGNLSKGHRANGFTTMGGFAEYVVNHVNTVHKFSDDISFDEAAMVTLAGTALYGIERAGGFVPGDTIVVLGPGAIGLMCVQCCKALGAGTIILTGTRDERLALGEKMGADHVINAARENPVERVKELAGGLGPNMVIVTTGNQDSLQQAIEMAPRGSDIVFLAHLDDPVTADIGLAVQKGNSIFTVRGEGGMSVCQAFSLMAQGKIMAEELVTHRFPLSRINEAINTFVERRNGAIKVVVHP
ncbi:MAG: alcohol dehydrogenase catalytic domain-containing protein [Syntrophales bacterium]|nr:alcohol dehydrogenase catalytic domain-containing protein [Syntrophales bacterium]